MSEESPSMREAFEAFVEATVQAKIAADRMRTAKAAFDDALVARSRTLQELGVAREIFDQTLGEFVGREAVEGGG